MAGSNTKLYTLKEKRRRREIRIPSVQRNVNYAERWMRVSHFSLWENQSRREIVWRVWLVKNWPHDEDIFISTSHDVTLKLLHSSSLVFFSRLRVCVAGVRRLLRLVKERRRFLEWRCNCFLPWSHFLKRKKEREKKMKLVLTVNCFFPFSFGVGFGDDEASMYLYTTCEHKNNLFLISFNKEL